MGAQRTPDSIRLLILSQFYPPEPIAKPAQLAREMVARGHAVTVLTGFPNYPSGHLYKGFRLRLFERSNDGAVEVLRAWLYPSHDASVWRRCLNYFSFLLSSSLASILCAPCDVVYAWHPPLTVGIAAWLIASARRVPLVYDVTDLWPLSGLWSGMLRRNLLYHVLELVESFVYGRADAIMAPTEKAGAHIIRRGVPSDKVMIGRHLVEDVWFSEPTRLEVEQVRHREGCAQRFVIVYAGNIGLVQDLEVVLGAAALVEPNRFLFLLIGDGVDRLRLERLSAVKGLSNVRFLGQRPASEVRKILGCAEAALVHLKPAAMQEGAMPAKALAYMAAKVPVLAAVSGACAELVRSIGSGMVVNPGDPAELSRGLRLLAACSKDERDRMAERGYSYAKQMHSAGSIVEDFCGLLSTTIAGTEWIEQG